MFFILVCLLHHAMFYQICLPATRHTCQMLFQWCLNVEDVGTPLKQHVFHSGVVWDHGNRSACISMALVVDSHMNHPSGLVG